MSHKALWMGMAVNSAIAVVIAATGNVADAKLFGIAASLLAWIALASQRGKDETD